MEKKRAYTGDQLRFIAEGVDNANSGCERLAEIFYAAVKADKALHSLQQAEPVFYAREDLSCTITAESKRSLSKNATVGYTVPLYTSPALPAGQWVKEGWKVVPIDPTGEMADAAMNAEDDSIRTLGHSVPFLDLWHAMLNAAPEPTED